MALEILYFMGERVIGGILFLSTTGYARGKISIDSSALEDLALLSPLRYCASFILMGHYLPPFLLFLHYFH